MTLSNCLRNWPWPESVSYCVVILKIVKLWIFIKKETTDGRIISTKGYTMIGVQKLALCQFFKVYGQTSTYYNPNSIFDQLRGSEEKKNQSIGFWSEIYQIKFGRLLVYFLITHPLLVLIFWYFLFLIFLLYLVLLKWSTLVWACK